MNEFDGNLCRPKGEHERRGASRLLCVDPLCLVSAIRSVRVVRQRFVPTLVALAMGIVWAPQLIAQETKTTPVKKTADQGKTDSTQQDKPKANQGDPGVASSASAKTVASQKRVMRPDDRPALEGYCPVAYMTEGKAVRGDAKYRSRHQGQVYYLSSAEAKKSFDTAPDEYLPQFGGLCTTALGGSYGKRLRSDPEVFDVFEGKLYLFSSERAKRAYLTEPKFFIYRGRNIFSQPAISGYCPVSYQARGRALEGKPSIQFVYGGRVYQFVTEGDKEKFIVDPEKYMPAYQAYCAEGVSKGRRYQSDARQYVFRNGRTFLFYDAKAKLTFLMNAEEYIKVADKQWAAFVDVKP